MQRHPQQQQHAQQQHVVAAWSVTAQQVLQLASIVSTRSSRCNQNENVSARQCENVVAVVTTGIRPYARCHATFGRA